MPTSVLSNVPTSVLSNVPTSVLSNVPTSVVSNVPTDNVYQATAMDWAMMLLDHVRRKTARELLAVLECDARQALPPALVSAAVVQLLQCNDYVDPSFGAVRTLCAAVHRYIAGPVPILVDLLHVLQRHSGSTLLVLEAVIPVIDAYSETTSHPAAAAAGVFVAAMKTAMSATRDVCHSSSERARLCDVAVAAAHRNAQNTAATLLMSRSCASLLLHLCKGSDESDSRAAALHLMNAGGLSAVRELARTCAHPGHSFKTSGLSFHDYEASTACCMEVAETTLLMIDTVADDTDAAKILVEDNGNLADVVMSYRRFETRCAAPLARCKSILQRLAVNNCRACVELNRVTNELACARKELEQMSGVAEQQARLVLDLHKSTAAAQAALIRMKNIVNQVLVIALQPHVESALAQDDSPPCN